MGNSKKNWRDSKLAPAGGSRASSSSARNKEPAVINLCEKPKIINLYNMCHVRMESSAGEAAITKDGGARRKKQSI